MRKRANCRSFRPAVTLLEQRRLLALTPTWIGQDGSDYTGTQSTLPPAPNDYQDIHIRLTGMTGGTVDHVQVIRHGAGQFDWYSSAASNAYFIRDPNNLSIGDIYFDPWSFADGPGSQYDNIVVYYAGGGGSQQTGGFTVPSGTPTINPNLRVPGKELSATFNGQLDGQDWAGPYIGVGPDGYKDFKIALSNLSKGVYSLTDVSRNPVVVVTASKAEQPSVTWQAGVFGGNLSAQMTAELLDWTDLTSTATANLFAAPTNNLSQGWSLMVDVTYHDQQREGKTDRKVIGTVTQATDPSAVASSVNLTNLATATAHSTAQDTGFPGNSHIALDTLPTGQSFSTVRSAILSNQAGSTWKYVRSGAPDPYTAPYSNPLTMQYNSSTGVFDFPPVRDEAGSTLTLLLTFDNGSQAVARFAGAN